MNSQNEFASFDLEDAIQLFLEEMFSRCRACKAFPKTILAVPHFTE